MTMQPKITGSKIKYRPMLEAELSPIERDRAYQRATRADRIARIAAKKLRAASMEMIERKPKMANWYCLRVMSGREYTVEKFLRDADVEVFMPVEKIVRVLKGKKIEGSRPFFPSYLLVRIPSAAEAFHALLGVEHVVEFVGGSAGYHVIRDMDVERFRALTTQEEVPYVKTDKSMKDGDVVDIVTGPFAGFTCLIVNVTWSIRARAKVVIDMGGRSFEIESMPLAFLRKS